MENNWKKFADNVKNKRKNKDGGKSESKGGGAGSHILV